MFFPPWKKRRLPGTAGISLNDDGVAVACIVRDDAAAPRLQGCAYHPRAENQTAAELLAAVVDAHGLERIRCVSVLEPEASNLLLVEAPEVEPTELKAAVRWRIKDLIDFHVDDAVVDVFDIPSQRGGRARMMYVVVARTSVVREHIDLLESAGAPLEVIDIPELVVRNVAAYLPEDDTGVALLTLGRHGGMVTLTRQGDLYLARALDVGIAQLIAQVRGAESVGEGEDGLTLEPRLANALTPSLQRMFDNIVLEVQRSLDYYESHFSLPPVSGLVVAPLEEPVPHLLGYLGANLGIPVRMMDLSALLQSDVPLSDELQAQCLAAIGAALRQETKQL